MIDSHLHVVDFLQSPLRAEAFTEALDGLDGAVVFGLPVKKKWALSEPERPTYYLDDNAPCGGYSLTDELVATLVDGLPAASRDRVAPLICGFDHTDRLGVDHVETMLARHDCWRGIGEVLLRHDDLTELTYGENARASHPALDPVLELCAAREWPVLVHQDASSAGRSGGREYVGELAGLVTRHPRVPVVWAHAGASRRIAPAGHVRLVEDLLAAHPLLHVDLSWVLLDQATDHDGRLRPDWTALVERHSDRFVVGTDVFGDLDDHGSRVASWQRALEPLTHEAQEQALAGNAGRLWWRR